LDINAYSEIKVNQVDKYNWDAQDYARNSQNQFQWAKELIPKLNLHGDEVLLDVGCGDGKITAEIASCLQNGRVIGIDSSPQMINLAKGTPFMSKFPNLSFELMDARDLRFNEEFDIIFSNAALHWVLDQKAVLEGVRRSLKPHGRLLFQMAGKGNAGAVLKIFDEMISLPKWQRYFEDFTFPYAFLDPPEYRRLLKQTGLVPNRVELFPKDMKFPSSAGMAGWIRTTWLPFTERVPAEQRERFISEIVNQYISLHPPGSDGAIHLDMIRLEVEANKP
jgi:trans-aconitate methyltransferase